MIATNPLFIVRIGLSFVFLYFGLTKIIDPSAWLAWVPQWMELLPGSIELNLITLCVKCHGKTNRNRQYWQDYYSNIIKEEYMVVAN